MYTTEPMMMWSQIMTNEQGNQSDDQELDNDDEFHESIANFANRRTLQFFDRLRGHPNSQVDSLTDVNVLKMNGVSYPFSIIRGEIGSQFY